MEVVRGKGNHAYNLLSEKNFRKRMVNERERERDRAHTRHWLRLLGERIEINRQLIHD